VTLDAEFQPGSDFRALAPRLRGAPKNIRKELNTAIKAITTTTENRLKRAVENLDSKGTTGGGSRQRERHNTTASGRLPKHTGLRRNIAKGVQRKITYSGFRTGVRIRVDPKYIPADQRALIRYTNSGKTFRHPVKGNRNVWVDQSFGPGHWFDDTIKADRSRILQQIDTAARRAMEQLQ
jgi:hypothetical protein